MFLAILCVLLPAVLYLQSDPTETFLETRGQFRDMVPLKHWTTGDSEVQYVGFKNHRDTIVARAYLRIPLQLEPDYDILITYVGHQTGRDILQLLPEVDDQVLVAMQYPYQHPESYWEYLRWIYDVRQGIYRTVAGGMLAVDYIENHPELDSDKIVVVGTSLGSIFGTILGGLDKRIPRVVIVHGGGDLSELVRVNPVIAKSAWPQSLLVFLAELFFGPFDPIHYVDRISPRSFVMLSSRNDRYFPEKSALALYESASDPKRIIWTDSGHIHDDRRELVRQIIHKIKRYFDNRAEPDG